ncbi:hypothetical protein KUTeg_015581 [Tegillarca granosa]|uniref:Uncharacterized protein n=1 Tax=Tegillarca granosa TaxID=220873 RepID=A0ABQ9EV85_TEGGR|nr:hypothetical protein KUTeg_015581 [Tegillarca granosa]
MTDVWYFIQNSHKSQNDYMFDICDGNQFQEISVFRRNSNAIQIILNTDEVEIVNPLGSHVKNTS